MNPLTPEVAEKIRKIISEHTSVLMQILVGGQKPSKELLKQMGIPEDFSDMVDSFYKFGKLTALQGADLSMLPAHEVINQIQQLTLTPVQQRAINLAKIRAGQYISALQQRMETAVLTSAAQADLTMWQTLQTEVPSAIATNMTRGALASRMREMTKDWNRDWMRVAHTELWEAKCQGEADAIAAKESPLSKDGMETYVYKRPAHNACDKCKQLYLEADGITPKTFKLGDLMANGNNAMRKQADWMPTVGCVHPNCHCVLNVKPSDTVFDKDGMLQYKPHNPVNLNSKVKVTVKANGSKGKSA